MAKGDRAAFLRQMVTSEKQMDGLFQQLAVDIGNLVLRAQASEGTVPIQALPRLQREAAGMVMARFLGADARPFDDDNEPLAEFPRIVSEGQRAMIELALEGTAAILDKVLPEDLRRELAAREVIE